MPIFQQKDIEGYWRLHHFRRSLESIFGSLDSQTVLNFHDWITTDICFETLNKQPTFKFLYKKYSNHQNLDWPCFPRLKPSVFVDSTHDLPGFKRFSRKFIFIFNFNCKNFMFNKLIFVIFILTHIDLKIIAWSKSGKVACSFGIDLVLWVPRNESTVVYKIDGIKALAFNNDGSLLAVGKKTFYEDSGSKYLIHF